MSSSLDDDQAAPIDRTALAVISNGDTAVELRLLGSFRKANAADCAALNAAVEQRDAAAVMRASHRVVGASRMAGATTLAAICGSIMSAVETGDWDAIAANRHALNRELERVGSYLDTLLRVQPCR